MMKLVEAAASPQYLGGIPATDGPTATKPATLQWKGAHSSWQAGGEDTEAASQEFNIRKSRHHPVGLRRQASAGRRKESSKRGSQEKVEMNKEMCVC